MDLIGDENSEIYIHLLTIQEVFVYKIPPLKTASGAYIDNHMIQILIVLILVMILSIYYNIIRSSRGRLESGFTFIYWLFKAISMQSQIAIEHIFI